MKIHLLFASWQLAFLGMKAFGVIGWGWTFLPFWVWLVVILVGAALFLLCCDD